MSSAMPRPTLPPGMPVPAPLGTTGSPCREAQRSIVADIVGVHGTGDGGGLDRQWAGGARVRENLGRIERGVTLRHGS